MALKYTDDALFDLMEIGAFIARDNPVRARSFVQDIRNHCEKLGLNPMIRAEILEIGAGVRRSMFGNYNVYYFPHRDDVVIFGIIEGHRRQARALEGRMES